jgi:hypothetical protein
MSLFRSARSSRSTDGAGRSRTRRALDRALATAPTEESRHELAAQATRL